MESLISFAQKYLRIHNETSLWKLRIILKPLKDKTIKMNKKRNQKWHHTTCSAGSKLARWPFLYIHKLYFTYSSGKQLTDMVWDRVTPAKKSQGN